MVYAVNVEETICFDAEGKNVEDSVISPKVRASFPYSPNEPEPMYAAAQRVVLEVHYIPVNECKKTN